MNLGTLARVIGGLWFVLGLTYLAIKTKGFGQKPVKIDFTET
jgi:hypothetical protein